MQPELVVTAALFLAGCAGLALQASAQALREPEALAADAAELRPALVNYVLTKCSPGAAAYQATILDLAARGHLAASYGQGTLWINRAKDLAGPARLAGSEQQVLDDARGRLKDTGAAPFEALAQACRADVHGTWEPFASKLREEARHRGLSHPRIPVNGWTVLSVLLSLGAIGPLAYFALRSVVHARTSPSVFAAIIAVIVFGAVLRSLEGDRLTSAGKRLASASRARRAARAAPQAAQPTGTPADPRQLESAAFAVAAGADGALPDPGQARRRRGVSAMAGGEPAKTGRPAEVWSSFAGAWRLVPIRPERSLGLGRGILMIAGAVWIGLIAYAISLAVSGLIPVIIALAAIGLGLLGARDLIRTAAIPNRATCQGQVIARWHEDSDSETSSAPVPFIAVDDGQRAWTFSGSQVFGKVALGDFVTMTVSPRSGQLYELTVTGRAKLGSDPPAWSLWPARTSPLITCRNEWDARLAVL